MTYSRTATVYPRVCGETARGQRIASLHCGLSPRVRGNQSHLRLQHHQYRSIPACAGKPDRRYATPYPRRVYPRVCGETNINALDNRGDSGLSPRVRGNQMEALMSNMNCGSIPACAGKPPQPLPGLPRLRVYPRVCGETRGLPRGQLSRLGLSPRVRGNHLLWVAVRHRYGSIPACAGKPRAAWPPCPAPRVYPRVCGETPFGSSSKSESSGLSPRVRGNQDLE